MNIKTKTIRNPEERRIITGLIVSTEFCKEISELVELDYFKNSYLKRLAKWSLDFYTEFKKSPYNHIEDIFEDERKTIPPEEAELINILLKKLAESYELDEINVDYLKKVTKEYFQKRELEILVGNISVLKEKDDFEQAEKQLDHYKKISFDLTGGFSDLSQPETLRNAFQNKTKEFFRLPGQLGQFLGEWDRGYLVAVLGAAKRGKTFSMTDIGVHGVLSELKVVHFSLEMPINSANERYYNRIVPTIEGDSGEYTIPVLDCIHNQNGNCADRTSKVIVLNEGGEIEENINHKVCTDCKGTKRYSYTIWSDTIHRNSRDAFNVSQGVRKFNHLLKRNLRVKAYPRFSVDCEGIERDIDNLITVENFIPDMIVIDYADIIKGPKGVEGVAKEDHVWMALARMAGERNILLITGTQGTRAAFSAETLSEEHQSKWIGALAHVDVELAINQTPSEKDRGICRIGLLAHRYKSFNTEQTCIVLQDLKTGQFCMDSYYY